MALRNGMRRKRRPAGELDEFGGRSDGGLAIIDAGGTTVHMTPARVAAAMRYFVARVQARDANGLPPVVAFTSAVVGEGVTYITRSLAAVLSYDTAASVVIVDLNWRRPVAREDGDAGPPLGLADAVEHGAAIGDVLIPTTNPRLMLVPPGEMPIARRPAVAGSEAIARVIDELAERFDFVLLDLPPVLTSSDALQLTQLADAFVLVVRQGSTHDGQVAAALEELRGIESLGVVLNRYATKIPKRLRRLVGA